MAWFPDLGNRCQVAGGTHVRAVGWLDSSHPYSRGSLAPDDRARLAEYAARWRQGIEPLNWLVAGGCHTCQFCEQAHTSGNFGIPQGDLLYVCPEMVAHYVEAHGYLPPAEFVEALRAAPLPGTPEYAEAVKRFRVEYRPRNSR